MHPGRPQKETEPPPPGTKRVRRFLLDRNEGPPLPGEVFLAEERMITLSIQGAGDFSTMALPRDLPALAAGFAFTEGIVSAGREIALIQACPDDPGLVRVLLEEAGKARKRKRNLLITGSCGICGGDQALEEILHSLPSVGNTLAVQRSWFRHAEKAMEARQELYRATRGTHAAGIFSARGEVLAFAEDVGRHNALDKAIGLCLLAGVETRGAGLLLSSRLSFELVAKAARAGLELVAALSAPSALAVEAARRWGITLCAPLREKTLPLLTHPHRIS